MFAVFTEDGLDQVCETRAIARKEARDLRDMGCEVRVVEGEELDFDAGDAFIREGGPLSRVAAKVKGAAIDREAIAERARAVSELAAPEAASGAYSDGDVVVNVVGIAARHYLVTRLGDFTTVHITGDNAAKLVKYVQRAGKDKDLLAIVATILNEVYIKPALKAEGFVGVGLIDTGVRAAGDPSVK